MEAPPHSISMSAAASCLCLSVCLSVCLHFQTNICKKAPFGQCSSTVSRCQRSSPPPPPPEEDDLDQQRSSECQGVVTTKREREREREQKFVVTCFRKENMFPLKYEGAEKRH